MLINYLKNMTMLCLHNISLLKIVLKWGESRLASPAPFSSSLEFDNVLILAIEDLSMIMELRDSLYKEIENTMDIRMTHFLGQPQEVLKNATKKLNKDEAGLVSDIRTHWSPLIKEAEDLLMRVQELQRKMEERKKVPVFSQVTPPSALLFSYSPRPPIYAFPEK